MIRVNFSGGGLFPDPGLLLLFEVDRQIGLPARIVGTLNDKSGIGLFPVDEALLKLVCLMLQNTGRKWAMSIRDWKAALDRFTIQLRSGCRSINKFRLHKIQDTLQKKEKVLLLNIKAYLLAHERIESGFCVCE